MNNPQNAITEINIETPDCQKTDDILKDVQYIIDTSQKTAYLSQYHSSAKKLADWKTNN